jgi:hypothetical protein
VTYNILEDKVAVLVDPIDFVTEEAARHLEDKVARVANRF